ncbi:MAG: four helix bundle protein [Candidatus Moranbacteria bacterium]|nr:four helix bundle protein [Candidatus Moranbacteria bacterium]
MTKKSENYNLEPRTIKFSGDVISFLKKLKRDAINSPLINQLVRSSTSVGANYCEANGASSRKDFKNKIYICKKECKETKYWLEIIARANEEHADQCRVLWKEAQELTMIFSKIILTLEKKSKD